MNTLQIDPLLKLIRKHEAMGDYNAIWHGIKKSDHPAKKITEMTVGDVLAWQDSVDAKYMSEAVGAYQFLEDTLRRILNYSNVRMDQLFDAAVQDKLALILLKLRGLDGFLSGKIPPVVFAQNLSKEWASLPCTMTDRKGRKAVGQSYYADDGLNISQTSIPSFMAVVQCLLVAPVPAPAVKTGLITDMVMTILSKLSLMKR